MIKVSVVFSTVKIFWAHILLVKKIPLGISI